MSGDMSRQTLRAPPFKGGKENSNSQRLHANAARASKSRVLRND
jgi:hypothetical protein